MLLRCGHKSGAVLGTLTTPLSQPLHQGCEMECAQQYDNRLSL